MAQTNPPPHGPAASLAAHAPPGSWAPVHRAVRGLARPVEAFLATEAASGVLLVLATLVALAWANSPWAASYVALWSTPIGARVGSWSLETPLRFVVDEVLMTLFFFVVGLEIRREVARGELSEPKRAALPIAAAVGGMIVPAAIYAALNAGRPSASGWGVPMATDIAFAVGVLTVVGKRVPPALRILLLSLAIIDDVGAILVIAVFYADGFSLGGLALAGGGMLGIFGLQRAGVRAAWIYVVPGAVVWLGLHEAGVHATLAGVLVGLATPAVAWLRRHEIAQAVARAADVVERVDRADLVPEIDALRAAGQEAIAPVDRLQHALHGVVAFVIMPVFALANAGVALGSVSFDDTMPVVAGVSLGLVLGKPVGIVLGSFVAVRLGIAQLPSGVSWRGVAVVGLAGGIGFTMSLFIAELAFDGAAHDAAKVAILVASTVAAGAAVLFAVRALPRRGTGAESTDAATETHAEQSTSA